MSKKDLRDYGYLTADEFVDIVTPGLRNYLKHNWGSDKDSL